MAYLDDTGLAYFWGKIKAWANSVFALLGHTHPASDVTAMTGYSMPSSTGAISSGDTLNQAVGKLEKAITAADISNVVHRTGDEDVAGKKFFQNAYRDRLVADPDGEYTSSVFLRAPTFDKGDATRTAYEYINFVILDRAGSELDWDGRLATLEYNTPATPGVHGQLKLSVYKNEHPAVVSNDNIASLYVGFDENDIPFAIAPSTSALRSVGGDIVTRNWIPNDTRIVHTTGNETIAGTKTFTNYLDVSRDGIIIQIRDPFVTIGQNPSIQRNTYIQFSDAAGTGISFIEHIVRTNGEALIRFTNRKNDASADYAYLELNCPASGAPYAWCPSTPNPTTENLSGRYYNNSGNTDIVTRDWIPRDTRIVHSTGNETVAGTKTFSSSPVVPTVSYTDNSTNAANTAWAFPRYMHYYTSTVALSLDLNSFTTPGQYFFQGDGGAGTSAANLPDGVNGTLLVFTTDSPYTTVQMFFRSGTKDVNDHRVFFRQRHDANLGTPSWSQWYRLFTDKDTIPVANGGTGQTSVANIQAGKDGNGNTISSTYLPLSGGTMTGSITMSNGNLAKRGITTDSLSIYNGTSAAGGGGIWMYGKDSASHGEVRLQAYNGTYRQLNCLSDGTLKWNGQTVQTTSDERLKTPMSDVPDDVLDAWGAVRWGQFQFLDAVEEKGSSARLHVGLIAQAVDRTFAAENLDVCRYGILCHEVRGAEGEVPAVEQWMARYTEALCMEAAYQRRENARLKKRVADLEDRLAALEFRLGSE